MHGRKNPLVYISICSTVGSVSVMSIKAFGIALKLTLGGNNQFTHPSTYVFIIVVVVCILTQMNYFNKALSQFSTNMYVCSQTIHTIQKLQTANTSQSQPSLLCHVYNLYVVRILYPVSRLQHHGCRKHHFTTMWLPHYLHWRLPTQPFSRRSGWSPPDRTKGRWQEEINLR